MSWDRDSATVFNSYQRRPGEGAPAILSVRVPVGLTEIDVPYVLADVPLGDGRR